MAKGNCEFKGSGRQYLEVFIVHIFLLSMVTLGIYAPWAWVRLFRLRASHTFINGRPMTFTGKGGRLFVLGLVNGLLTLITLGIYWPWAACRISRWKARNTLVDGKPSGFVGTGGALFLFSIIHFFILPVLTFGLYTFYAMYRFYAWKEEHCRYGGARTSFGAGFWGLLKIYLISIVILILFPAVGPLVNMPAIELLSPLIFIIASPWLVCMFFRWQTRGLAVGDEEGIEHFPPVRTRVIPVLILFLIGLFAMGTAALFIKEQFEKQTGGMDNLSRLLGMKDRGAEGPEAVRGTVKRPSVATAPAPEKKPSPGVPAATAPPAVGPAGTPSPEKSAPEEPLFPVWARPAAETAPPSEGYEREIRGLDAFIEKDGQNVDAYYSRGCLYARKGDLVEAEKDFTRAIEINNRNSDAFYNRGLVRVRLKDFELAITDFDQAIELNPQAADAYCNRGSAYFNLGNSDLALKDYSRALAIKSDDADLYYNRGLVYLSMNRKAEAKADFQKATALKAAPTSKPPAEKAEETK